MNSQGCFNSCVMRGSFPPVPVVHPDGSHNLTMDYDSCNHTISGHNPSNCSLTSDQSNSLIFSDFLNVVKEHDSTLFDSSINGSGSSSYEASQKNVLRRPWTTEEDQKLTDLVSLHGEVWPCIAEEFSFRTRKQCRERWYGHLRPGIKKGPWSEEEDRVLIEAHAELGNKWSMIAERLPGRTENSVKNRWHTNRRQWTRINRRRRRRTSGSSLLQNYMQSSAQVPAADRSENMPDAVQQIHYGDRGATSGNGSSTNGATDLSRPMYSPLLSAYYENWEMNLPGSSAFDDEFIF